MKRSYWRRFRFDLSSRELHKLYVSVWSIGSVLLLALIGPLLVYSAIGRFFPRIYPGGQLVGLVLRAMSYISLALIAHEIYLNRGFRWWQRERRRFGRCIRCGYDLHGGNSINTEIPRCSECGTLEKVHGVIVNSEPFPSLASFRRDRKARRSWLLGYFFLRRMLDWSCVILTVIMLACVTIEIFSAYLPWLPFHLRPNPRLTWMEHTQMMLRLAISFWYLTISFFAQLLIMSALKHQIIDLYLWTKRKQLLKRADDIDRFFVHNSAHEG